MAPNPTRSRARKLRPKQGQCKWWPTWSVRASARRDPRSANRELRTANCEPKNVTMSVAAGVLGEEIHVIQKSALIERVARHPCARLCTSRRLAHSVSRRELWRQFRKGIV